MARFDDELIRRLKEETDIVRLIESYGTKLKPRPGGDELIGTRTRRWSSIAAKTSGTALARAAKAVTCSRG